MAQSVALGRTESPAEAAPIEKKQETLPFVDLLTSGGYFTKNDLLARVDRCLDPDFAPRLLMALAIVDEDLKSRSTLLRPGKNQRDEPKPGGTSLDPNA